MRVSRRSRVKVMMGETSVIENRLVDVAGVTLIEELCVARVLYAYVVGKRAHVKSNRAGEKAYH